MTRIIAVCGSMGSGKSTLIQNVSAAVADCEAVFEDDYNRTTERSLNEIQDWWKRGGSVDEFDLSGLIGTLAERFPSRIPGAVRQKTAPGRPAVVLVETHFGRLHSELRPWIDLQCWVDVPADTAVVRKVAQLACELKSLNGLSGESDGLRWIEEFCRGYLNTTCHLFEMQRHQVRSLSDLIIDGLGTPFDVCSRFLASLPQEFHPEV